MDLTITIDVSDISYNAWLRTSYAGLSIVDKEGIPKIEAIELGIDQRDAFNSFVKEASLKVLKLFMTRQGDVVGLPYEFSTTEITYRFLEGVPAFSVNKTSSLMTQLKETVGDAIYSYISALWYLSKGLDISKFYFDKYSGLSGDIERGLINLHD